MVYVLDVRGKPLMPTERHGRVRHLLKDGKAAVVRRTPFTIRLLYESGGSVQDVSLGIDAGSKHIGVSATAKNKVLYEADVELRNDITELLSNRRQFRRTRRNRKTRYRQARFDNRTRGDRWLPPSIRQKTDTHISAVRNVCAFLPVSKITVETAAFDLQKLKADLAGLQRPEGKEYQQGDQLGFWNCREYVLHRDGHRCRACQGRSKDPVLNVHHIESRKTGGDAPNNLVTLCETCHKGYHNGTVKLPEDIRRGASFRDAVFMGIMRWAFYNALKEEYPDVHMTFGYITKNTRIRHRLPKEHYVDARCISGNPAARSDGTVYFERKIRCHNRQIHKATIQKGGIRKRNQAPYFVKGFRLYDKVLYRGTEWYIHGRRTKGSFVLKTLAGDKTEVAPSKIRFVETAHHHMITERRTALPPTAYAFG